MMDSCDPASNLPRKPRIVVAACGGADAAKFGNVCSCFTEWAEVKAVVTKSSFRFVLHEMIPKNVSVHGDEDEWETWKCSNDIELHIQLCKWADIMVIAPLSAKTLANIAGGLCDNLLTCIVRAWDEKKPLFVAPSMGNCMWRNPTTERQCESIKDELGIILIPPGSYVTPAGECECGAMSEPSTISATVRKHYNENMQNQDSDSQV